jgi:hypothetical protein
MEQMMVEREHMVTPAETAEKDEMQHKMQEMLQKQQEMELEYQRMQEETLKLQR